MSDFDIVRKELPDRRYDPESPALAALDRIEKRLAESHAAEVHACQQRDKLRAELQAADRCCVDENNNPVGERGA